MSPLNLIIPAGVAPEMKLSFMARALRGLCDGYVAILLPAYLLALGLGTLEVGVISTATLLGSATLTLTVGAWGYRFHHRVLLLAAAMLMMLTGFGLAGLSSFWPLLLVAFVGTINPSSGDVSVFLPLEHARIAEAAQGDERTKVFARYSLIGALFAAVGALAAGLPDVMVSQGMDNLMAMRMMFVLYGCTGIIVVTRCDRGKDTSRGRNAIISRARIIVVAWCDWSKDTSRGRNTIVSGTCIIVIARCYRGEHAAGYRHTIISRARIVVSARCYRGEHATRGRDTIICRT